MALTIEVPEDIALEVREFLERAKTGQIEFHVVNGKVLGVDCLSQKRTKRRDGPEMGRSLQSR